MHCNKQKWMSKHQISLKLPVLFVAKKTNTNTEFYKQLILAEED